VLALQQSLFFFPLAWPGLRLLLPGTAIPTRHCCLW